MTEDVLKIKHLSVDFRTMEGNVHAIRDVTLKLHPGEVLALVGESGSGKSVTTKTIMQLLPNNAEVVSGTVEYKGRNLLDLPEKELQQLRGNELAEIFQDPMTALDPTVRVGKQIMEPLLNHKQMAKGEAKKQALAIMNKVGIVNAKERFNNFPYQFSGGMRQRIVIAMALICHPQILIADEPTTALDVTIQSQILRLIKQLKDELGTAVIFITHDLGVVAGIADRVAVMYAGRILEFGTVEDIFYHPQHPYTVGLLKSTPTMDMSEGELESIPGNPPNLINPPVGDPFASRNEYALAIDYQKLPPFFKISDTHYAATWLLDKFAPKLDLTKKLEKRRVHYANLVKEDNSDD
ncbi:ABC transporter ATP-binding protein [Limosilactobacillus reuteri]|uniref:ATP-binding cassette domain-containing protein n=1 Tax=Limosilactobacillus reuteri TaxID=1598 RepID=A0A347T6Q1_LIMRT|nr:ABC transporter ATP-binding protein [Limosilactobacillus reuteri]AXX73600.1 ATP-binding cassette domain-containing protein [Limosilactobacillus reuteri]MRG68393.1 ATP-binding cassette domain-containing protein [Limosilactobacillus reuteri]WJK31084.1 ABC transporter ATP-binding protein [Limosilactobacillus reuteri]WLR79924.1 ABC transporter ATP-binding protein [Limosilactobacillus reuteri]